MFFIKEMPLCPQWKVRSPNGQKHLSLENTNSTFLVGINLEGGIFCLHRVIITLTCSFIVFSWNSMCLEILQTTAHAC